MILNTKYVLHFTAGGVLNQIEFDGTAALEAATSAYQYLWRAGCDVELKRHTTTVTIESVQLKEPT